MDWNMDSILHSRLYCSYGGKPGLPGQGEARNTYSSPHRCQQSLLLYSTSCIILVRSSTQALLAPENVWWAAVGCSWPHPAQSWLATTARRLSIFHAVHGPVHSPESSLYTVPAMRGGPGDVAIPSVHC